MPPLWTLVYPRLRTHPDRSTTKPVAGSLSARARPAVSPRPSLHSPIARCPAPGPAGGEHDRGEFTTDRAPVGFLLEHREHPAAGAIVLAGHFVGDVALQIHWQVGSWSSTLRLRLPDNAEPAPVSPPWSEPDGEVRFVPIVGEAYSALSQPTGCYRDSFLASISRAGRRPAASHC